MEWMEFKKLKINEQIELINNLIKEHGSITKAAKQLGRSDKTVREHFNSLGYRFIDGIYIKNINIPLNNETSLTEHPSEDKKESNMLNLEQMVNRMVEKRFSELVKEQPIDRKIELSSKCDGEIKYRSFGVYENVWNEVSEWIKDQRYTQVEIISQALLEFKERHK